jgi:hypothetical protein
MQSLLVAMGTSNSKKMSTNPLLAGQKLEEFALRYTAYHLNETEISLKRSNIGTLFGYKYSNVTWIFFLLNDKDFRRLSSSRLFFFFPVLHAKMVYPGSSNYLFEVNEGANQDTNILLPKENFDEKGKISTMFRYFPFLEVKLA